jgi:hypothetical protein
MRPTTAAIVTQSPIQSLRAQVAFEAPAESDTGRALTQGNTTAITVNAAVVKQALAVALNVESSRITDVVLTIHNNTNTLSHTQKFRLKTVDTNVAILVTFTVLSAPSSPSAANPLQIITQLQAQAMNSSSVFVVSMQATGFTVDTSFVVVVQTVVQPTTTTTTPTPTTITTTSTSTTFTPTTTLQATTTTPTPTQNVSVSVSLQYDTLVMVIIYTVLAFLVVFIVILVVFLCVNRPRKRHEHHHHHHHTNRNKTIATKGATSAETGTFLPQNRLTSGV